MRSRSAAMRPTAAGGGGGTPALSSQEGEMLGITRASPADGTIRIGLWVIAEMATGDVIELKATLSSP